MTLDPDGMVVRRMVAGLGSPFGDDQAGWATIDRLRPLLPADALVRRVGDGVGLLDMMAECDDLIVVDAASPAGHPGRLRAFEWPCEGLDDDDLVSTHGLGLVSALRLAEGLGLLPRRVRILAIEAEDVAPGRDLGHAAARGVADAIATIVRELGSRPDRGSAALS